MIDRNTTRTLPLFVLLAACSGGDTNADDLKKADASIGGDATVDAGTSNGCSSVRRLNSYPYGMASGAYFGTGQNSPPNDVATAVKVDGWDAASKIVAEVWFGGGLQPPATRTFSDASTYAACDVCVTMSEGCVDNVCKTVFFGQAGELDIIRADRNADFGGVKVHGTDLFLREWSLNQDKPKAGGKCVELANLDIEFEWTLKGPACSGDFCETGGGCCEEAPYCVNGSGSDLRYCSSSCGGAGDGCAAPADCCDGYTCSDNRCVLNTCVDDACTEGFDDAGGCCGAAPYCVDSRCALSCGESGTGCGSAADCCTGLSCQGGKCT
jgi:hypothetical protein